MTDKVIFAQNTNHQTIYQSSSGGIFSALSEYILAHQGVVFGAMFDRDFKSVSISYTETDVTNMRGSKYVKSSVGTSYKDCKQFLDAGRLVLYTGTPCQIFGLRAFLKHDYSNLFTVDVICHGSPELKVWQRYIESFNKRVVSVNFRDKTNGWEHYNVRIKFEDGTELNEPYQKNKYMQLFLNNKILTEPCYSCKCCKNSKSDLTIGDAWGATPSSLNKHSGISVIILHSERGEALIKLVNSVIKQVNGDSSFLKTSYGYMHNYTKPNDADRIKRSICSPKIAMVTIPGHKNVGNTLQAYSLQQKIKEIVPAADIKLINQYNTAPNSFFEKYVKYEPHGYNSNYDMLVVGSDQIWSDGAYIRKMGVPFNDQWLNRPCSYKLVYGASFGKHELSFTPDQRKDISMSLKQVSYIGVREMSGIFVLDKYFGIHNAVSVIDPTMLHDADFYLNTINETPCLDTDGIFAYILDNSTEWQSSLKKLADTLGTAVLPFDGSCEQFISNMNKAKYVITDSYHGTVFSLIFNKPFITYRNVARGNDRFDDLYIRFKPIRNQFVTKVADICNADLLNVTPNVQNYILYFRQGSLDFLRRGLYQL